MLLSPRKGVAMLAGLASWFCAFSVISCQTQQRQTSWTSQRSTHQASTMNADQVRYLASLSNMQSFDAILDPILVPRPVGSQNHEIVKEYIRSQMQSAGWDVMFDSFIDNTPFGAKNFTNIVTTLDPGANRRLVLACHYDSKYSREGVFVGATDSAVPCAMLISLAKDMARELDQFKAGRSNVTLQFIFFDGEEAFREWTSTDSIYGARHLAQRWASEPYPSNTREGTRELQRMDMMVLLDLLGAPNPRFFNYFQATDRWYKQMKSAEQRLKKAGFLRNHNQNYFREGFTYGGIEDDHKPFLERGVPILHLITSPFPSVWHTNADNKAALDYTTIDNLNKILRVFVAEYLRLQV